MKRMIRVLLQKRKTGSSHLSAIEEREQRMIQVLPHVILPWFSLWFLCFLHTVPMKKSIFQLLPFKKETCNFTLVIQLSDARRGTNVNW